MSIELNTIFVLALILIVAFTIFLIFVVVVSSIAVVVKAIVQVILVVSIVVVKIVFLIISITVLRRPAFIMVLMAVSVFVPVCVIFIIDATIHGQGMVVGLWRRRVVMHGVRGDRWRRYVHGSHTRVNIPIEVLQVQVGKVEQAAEHRVGDLHFPLLEDDVRECNND